MLSCADLTNRAIQAEVSHLFLSLTSACSPFSGDELAACGVSKLHRVLVGEDLWGSPRQPSSHVMIVVVMVVVMVVVVVVMVVVVLLGEC